jgi:hypothetical protein
MILSTCRTNLQACPGHWQTSLTFRFLHATPLTRARTNVPTQNLGAKFVIHANQSPRLTEIQHGRTRVYTCVENVVPTATPDSKAQKGPRPTLQWHWADESIANTSLLRLTFKWIPSPAGLRQYFRSTVCIWDRFACIMFSNKFDNLIHKCA